MPNTCYSFPVGMPPGSSNDSTTQPPLPGVRRMPYPCYSYPSMCFSYPDDMPLGGGSPAADQVPPPGLRRMPFGSCFRY